MSAKIGRNDPCPCGSGRKYKHCCGRAAATSDDDQKEHAGAVERGLDWLARRHRKASGAAIEAMLFGGLLERVKGLLRGYEASEAQHARRDGRRTISYAFLWEALGIAR